MMGESRAVLETAVGADEDDVGVLRRAARDSGRKASGEHVLVVPTRLLDALLRLPAACVALVDVWERELRTRHPPQDFAAAEAELREVVAQARATP